MTLRIPNSFKVLLVVGVALLVAGPAHADLVADKEYILEFDADIEPAHVAGSLTAFSPKKQSVRRKLIKKSAKRVVKDVIAKALKEQCDKLIKETPGARSCTPNYRFQISATPNDPNFAALYGMNKISAPAAWEINTGNPEVVVAVIDTGVDYTHTDLVNNMWQNPGEIPANGIDDDANGYVDDVYGYDFANADSDPRDDHSHGTHVAGTIGAEGNNGVGVAGVNWHVKIMALKFLDASGGGYLSDAIDAVRYAVANGAKVTNNSWGGGGYSRALYNVINEANESGVLFVAAAGNEANDNDASPSYPAGYDLPNVISVAATDRNDNLAYFSNYGANTVHIAAPGTRILSTVLNNQYAAYSGTSMATPHVAGAAALLLSANPELTALQIKDLLLNNGDAVASLGGFVVTASRMNIAKAMFAGIKKNTENSLDISVNGRLSRTKKTADVLYGGKVAELGLINSSDQARTVTIALELYGTTCSSSATVDVAPGANVFVGKLPAFSSKGTYLIRAIEAGARVGEASGKIVPTRGQVASKAVTTAQIQRQCVATLAALF